MTFHETELPGAYIIDVDRIVDERGFFGRTFCMREFEAHGLNSRLVQCSVCFTPCRGTLRGIHFQKPPHQEAKLVRCTAGSIFDVIIDLRVDSPTFLRHIGVELNAHDYRLIYVPEGFAHGSQTLMNGSEVAYQMSEWHDSAAASGVRWNDPIFAIRWPLEVSHISERDKQFPDFQGATDLRLANVCPEVA